MEKDRPFVPRIIERALQFLHVRHHTEAPLRVRPHRNRVESIPVGGTPAGVLDTWFGDGPETVHLSPDDILVLYTDGLTEARADEVDFRLFGPSGVRASLRTAGAAHGWSDLDRLGASLVADAKRHAGGTLTTSSSGEFDALAATSVTAAGTISITTTKVGAAINVTGSTIDAGLSLIAKSAGDFALFGPSIRSRMTATASGAWLVEPEATDWTSWRPFAISPFEISCLPLARRCAAM